MYRGIRIILFVGLALFTSVETSAQQEQDETLIEAQALGSALQVLAEEYDLQVLFESAVVANHTARSIPQGTSRDAALGDLLAGTHLTYEFVNERTVAIRGGAGDVASEGEGGASDSKNLSPTSILITQKSAEGNRASSAGTKSVRRSDDDTPADLEEIIVTGTNIRGVVNPTVPLLQFDRKDIELSGAVTVDDFLRTIPQNFASGTVLAGNSDAITVTRNGNTTQGTTPDLRGLGAGSTLTLVNGRRLAPAGSAGAVDINILPLGAIERVDVVTDGATAAYGSDAVGGVMNFITRQDYEGFEVRARYGYATGNSKEEVGAGAAGGFNWSSGNLIVGTEYVETTPLKAGELDFVDPVEVEEDANFGSASERLSFTGNLNQRIGNDGRFGMDFLYADNQSETFSTIDAVPRIYTIDQIALTLGTKLEYDFNERFTATLLADLSQTRLEEQVIDALINESVGGVGEFDNDLHAVEGRLSGELLNIPGGEVKFSLGGLYREEVYELRGDGAILTSGERQIHSGYAELLVPVFGENNALPLMQALSLSVQGRYEDYSDFGDSFDPRFGIYWELSDELAFRSAYSEAFRVPDLQSLNADQFVFVSTLPALVFTAIAPDEIVVTDPVPAYITIQQSGGNPDLMPERAETWSAGFTYEPKFLDGLTITGNYYDISYTDRIEFVFSRLAVQDPAFFAFVDIPPDLAEVQALFDLGASPDALLFNNGNFAPEDVQVLFKPSRTNVAEREVRGFDLNVGYATDTDIGQLSASLNAAFMFDYIGRLTSVAPSSEQLDTLFRPVDLKLRSVVTLARDRFSGSVALNYVDSYRDDIDSSVANKIGEWTTFDLNLTYNTGNRFDSGVLDGIRLSFGVTNLFDRDPPFVDTLFGLNYDSINATPFGREIKFAITKSL